MSHYIIWYTDVNEKGKEYENYTIVQAMGITSARAMADEMFGDFVISVEPYTP